ncbi:hypothetical protein HRI_000085000 [Hibiscus trionum]|uniref:Reverse transcriptase domain-containing protein n=1 Tax=Hibiscus trionum TaxID=183268 RepID=A0A9W7LH53_HIBTR|nr:hypothetical protein HRI_000085000 [Hibiscus trionum]
MGFGEVWHDWVQKCVASATISVLVNGSPMPQFSIGKGLRQGCSLSPLLFNLVGEALHLMLVKAESLGMFKGFQVGNIDPFSLSHLQFADDLIIFCGAALGEIKNIKRILRIFEVASGLQLNLKKSMLFGVNVRLEDLNLWAKSIGCDVGKFPAEYLGLPLGVERSSKAMWDPMINKIYHNLSSWKANNLSFSGRLVLIKSVLLSLPTYFLSMFRLPQAVASKINKIIAKFLWGGSDEKRKIH